MLSSCPHRKDYLSLFAGALQKDSPHYLAPGEMQNCLEVGTGTGVLSFILSATSPMCAWHSIPVSSNFVIDPDVHGAKRVTGVDINEDAVLNALENRALLGKNESELAFVHADLFPAATDSDAKYDLLVCNPPWLPMPVATAEAHNPGTDGLMGGVLDRGGDVLPALFRGLTDRLSSRPFKKCFLQSFPFFLSCKRCHTTWAWPAREVIQSLRGEKSLRVAKDGFLLCLVRPWWSI